MNLHALGRSRLAWLDRFIVPRETPLAPSRWHQHIGRVMDRLGALKTQALTGLLIPIIPTAWIWVTAPWQVGVLEAYAGLVWAGYNLANFALLLELTPGSHRPQAVAPNVLTGSLRAAG